jgi:hypothetical protein
MKPYNLRSMKIYQDNVLAANYDEAGLYMVKKENIED